MMDAAEPEAPREASAAVIITDDRYAVKFLSQRLAADDSLRRLLCEGEQLASGLRELLTRLGIVARNLSGSRAVPLDEQRIIHCSRLLGPAGDLIMLTVETDRNLDALNRAAVRFSLTRRETAVLALVLEGAKARQIAEALIISEHTVHGYMKRLIAKTNARNRAAMVALVLDWDRSHQPYHQTERGTYRDDGLPSGVRTAYRRS